MAPAQKKQKQTDEVRVTRSSVQQPPQPSTSKPSKPPPTTTTTSDDDNMDDDDEQPFEYESDFSDGEQEQEQEQEEEDEDEVMVMEGQEAIIISEDDELEPPPEPRNPSKGKLSSRKQYQVDVTAMMAKYGATASDQVIDFKKQGDETVEFCLLTPGSQGRPLKLVLMCPELSGYPTSHQCVCFAENEVGPDTEAIIEEIAQLPHSVDRSVNGIVDYLISRLILKRPAPSYLQPRQSQGDDSDYDEYDDDDLFGIANNSTSIQSAAFLAALRQDFKEIIAAGFRPGFCRLSELDNVVTVSKKVNSLGVPLRALQAWDSDLITGEVRYLVLLMNFGSKYPVDPDNGTKGDVSFRIGISPKYKPSKDAIGAAFRSHSETYTKGDFDPISLSQPFDSLFHDMFQQVLKVRRSVTNLGWAGAEHHCLLADKGKPINKKDCQKRDKEEKEVADSYTLPVDPMGPKNDKPCNNYPLLAYSYLVRRFVMCPRFCLICYKRIESGIVALKPFVCESPLCLYQLIDVGLGISLEHEIKTNYAGVDLLVQLAYVSAKENGLTAEQQPIGLGLEIAIKKTTAWKKGDPTEDFDAAELLRRNEGMADLINELPPILELKSWLLLSDLPEGERLTRPRKLADIRNGVVSASAWKLLRWIVASNTSYLKQIEEDDELIGGVPPSNRQFRLVVGSPAKEHFLNEAIKAAQAKSENAKAYPTLYAWHGSAVKNWHSILREGLHFNKTINGRAYGHGVYFAKEGETSLGTYATASTSVWKGAEYAIGKMAAVCEIANLPSEFVSTNPYFVCQHLEWIQCRYLIVQRNASYGSQQAPAVAAADATAAVTTQSLTRLLPLDPAHPIRLSSKPIQIPDILPKLQVMDRKLENTPEEFNLSDTELMKEPPPESPKKKRLGGQGSMASVGGSQSSKAKKAAKSKAEPDEEEDPFKPCGADILRHVRLLPPPKNPNKVAVMAIQREMMAMVKEQETEGPSKCGFYFDPERSNDNLFNWIVELTGFDPDLPIYKDMATKKVTSLLFEIRFSENYPFSPPFFRMVYPRFLPFIQGGGGHVTGGGSICMDLLTSDGWSSVYSMSAILLQIRMAISNLEPRPARLDPNRWNIPYSMVEAVDGYKRAAATHGWTVPPELDQLTRQF